jgi:hypothetical protein
VGQIDIVLLRGLEDFLLVGKAFIPDRINCLLLNKARHQENARMVELFLTGCPKFGVINWKGVEVDNVAQLHGYLLRSCSFKKRIIKVKEQIKLFLLPWGWRISFRIHDQDKTQAMSLLQSRGADCRHRIGV